MNEQLQTHLNILMSGSVDETLFRTLINEFVDLSKDTQRVSDNRQEFAQVFYQLLCACKSVFSNDKNTLSDDDIPKDIIAQILIGFANIKYLSIEANEKQKDSSSVRIIWFLNQLKTFGPLNRMQEIDVVQLKQYAESLLDVLDDIKFIFNIKDSNNNYVFPINKVLVTVIQAPEFINNSIDNEDIRILQLAVRLFQKDSDEAVVLDKLRDQCNLGFIDYLKNDCEIIDTIDFLNYKNNGTMIFHDDTQRKILIRSENKIYFKNSKCTLDVKEEVDFEKRVFGWYVEYDLAQDDCLSNYSTLLKDETKRNHFLKIVFDQGYYNIFLEKSLVFHGDGSIEPVNPFCKFDEYVIRGDLRDKSGEWYRKDDFLKAIHEFRMCPVRQNRLNRVSLGLCCLLLTIKNIGVTNLKLDEMQEDCWYQEQVVNNWINNENVESNDLLKLLEFWYKQLEYCIIKNGIEKQNVTVQDFFPLSHTLNSVYQKMGTEIRPDEHIFCGTIVRTDDDHSVVEVKMRNTVAASILKNSGRSSFEIDLETLIDLERSADWLLHGNVDIYFTYSEESKIGHIFSQRLLKTISGIEWIQESTLRYSVGKLVNGINYDSLKKRMLQFRSTFGDIAVRTGVGRTDNLEVQIYYRVLHNMLWTGINESNINDYFDIIRKHEIITFKDIEEDMLFKRDDKETLFIPKDKENAGAVLSDVFKTYLQDRVVRENRPLYNVPLKIADNGHYSLKNGNIIKKIVLLTDNFIFGHSTNSALAAYFGIEQDDKFRLLPNRVSQSKETIEVLLCDNTAVSLQKIMEVNENPLFHVHAYCGTDEGIEQIKQFLKSHGVCDVEVSYCKKLTAKVDGIIIEKMNKLWPSASRNIPIKEGHYMFIREFSMPKCSVFPDIMLDNPNLAICLFVRKKELNFRT